MFIYLIKRPEHRTQQSNAAATSVYYSEVLPYTESGYYESFSDINCANNHSLDTDRAFSILSFVRSKESASSFVESVSCDILEQKMDTKPVILIDGVMDKNNTVKIFVINNGWGDSDDFTYSVSFSKYDGFPEFSKLMESISDSGTCSVKKESASLLGAYSLNVEEVEQWATQNDIESPIIIGHIDVNLGINSTPYSIGELFYHKESNSFTLYLGGAGKYEDYYVTLYALLNVDKKPPSIHFTGIDATPLIEDKYRIETVIIPTKSVSLKCQGVYSIDGVYQKTDVYDVHVNVPVFNTSYFQCNGWGTMQLAAISMDDKRSLKRILNEARYNPESILENHLDDGK